MQRFTYCSCHITLFGLIFDFINLFLFILLLCGTLAVPLQDKCNYGANVTSREREACGVAIAILVSSIVLTLVEIIFFGVLITVALYERKELAIGPLIVSYMNIVIAAGFAVLAIVDFATGNRGLAKYIWTMLFAPHANADDKSEEQPIFIISICLASLLVVAFLFCTLNAFVHTRIWQFYKWKSKHDDRESDTTSQLSIIASFSMSMVYDEWRAKLERLREDERGGAITSIAEEDEGEESDFHGFW